MSRPVASSSQPIGLRGCRRASSRPTSGALTLVAHPTTNSTVSVAVAPIRSRVARCTTTATASSFSAVKHSTHGATDRARTALHLPYRGHGAQPDADTGRCDGGGDGVPQAADHLVDVDLVAQPRGEVLD